MNLWTEPDNSCAYDMSLQGNRVKKSTANETCQVVVVPRGNKAAGPHGVLFAGRF
jgi:hypothetical protein